jgi:hypothetical protein
VVDDSGESNTISKFWSEVEPDVPTEWLVWAAGVLPPLGKVQHRLRVDVHLGAAQNAYRRRIRSASDAEVVPYDSR